ncbi:MAG: DnaJ domain-containing protein [Calditrichaeota bacterium]|nr:DnaJ domain-containing protein [Calditrichota bacterium]
MALDDFYLILGIDRNADQATIKKAFRQLAKKYHPDKGKEGDEEKLKRVNEAYSILSDQKKRADYDKRLEQEEYERTGRVEPAVPWNLNWGLDEFFSDFWKSPFQTGDQGDYELEFDVFLDSGKANREKEFEIKFSIPIACSACGGTGWTRSGVCSLCWGRGYLLKDVSLTVHVPEQVHEGLIQWVTYSDDRGNDYGIRIIYHIE